MLQSGSSKALVPRSSRRRDVAQQATEANVAAPPLAAPRPLRECRLRARSAAAAAAATAASSGASEARAGARAKSLQRTRAEKAGENHSPRKTIQVSDEEVRDGTALAAIPGSEAPRATQPNYVVDGIRQRRVPPAPAWDHAMSIERAERVQMRVRPALVAELFPVRPQAHDARVFREVFPHVEHRRVPPAPAWDHAESVERAERVQMRVRPALVAELFPVRPQAPDARVVREVFPHVERRRAERRA